MGEKEPRFMNEDGSDIEIVEVRESEEGRTYWLKGINSDTLYVVYPEEAEGYGSVTAPKAKKACRLL